MASALEIFQKSKRTKITKKSDATYRDFEAYEQHFKKKLAIKISQTMLDNFLDIHDLERITNLHKSTIYSILNSLLNNKKIIVTTSRLLEILFYLGVEVDANIKRRGPVKSRTLRRVRRVI